MGNRATITAAPFDRKNVAIYVHWNGGRTSVEAFCKAAKELGYRDPAGDPAYGMARLTGLIATFFGIDEDTGMGIGTVDQLIEAGDDNGCWVIGEGWTIVERRNCGGKVGAIPKTLEYDVDEMARGIVARVRLAAGVGAAEVR